MTRTQLRQCTLSLMLIPLLMSGYGTAHAQPTSGDWKASTEFGELGFTVNLDGTKVIKLIRDVRNWSCGPVSGSWTSTTYFTDPQAGWPISNGQFAITINGSMASLATVWTVNGTFSNTGKEASGTWGFSISGTICSGNWGLVGPVVSVEDDIDFPERFALSQNYPNPFNPTTVISYQLPVVSYARLVVYDVLGHEVSLLVNERKEAGVHEVTFDGTGLSSGVYFYRLQVRPLDPAGSGTGDFTQTRRLSLLK